MDSLSPEVPSDEATIELATRPTRGDWISYGLVFVMLTAIGAIVPLMAAEHFALNSPSGRAPLCAVIVCFACVVPFSFQFVKSRVNRHYWRLTESELIGGRTENIHLPLSSVEKIVIEQKRWLLVIFRDRSLLQLKLRFMPNGGILMKELVSRLADRVDRHDTCSEEEKRLIRRWRGDPNVVIRKGS
jgi:hypothetical protein